MDPPGGFGEDDVPDSPQPQRALPDDLPKSLNDRRSVPQFTGETEMYDGWQGQTQYLANPVANFKLSLHDESFEDDLAARQLADNDTRLMTMLAAQASHRGEGATADEDSIANDEKLTDDEKKTVLQKALNMAASNGETERIERLATGPSKKFIDINAADEEGTAPLIYASCFGHEAAVKVLLDAGANPDTQDKNQWSPLMWAMTNRHKGIAKLLLDHGASPEIKSSSGRTAFDFVAPNSDLSDYLNESGYAIGNAGISEDFYETGLSQDRFEEEMQENELKRRMAMESAINLEVDLSSLGLDEQPETPEEPDDFQEFIWDKCLNDQMFVFQENELDRILEIIITKMAPQRSASQKPVPANILFLAARYAHYHASGELLEKLLLSAMSAINEVVERQQWDMTMLAFWMSNATLLLYYLKKDAQLVGATVEFQQQVSELINEIFILIIRDAERRMDKVFNNAMLDHETIPGFEDVHFQSEWRIFRTKKKVEAPETINRFRPPSPKQRAKPSPRNITSLLSSCLFVLDLYDIHSFITAQIVAQIFYWLGAELFNRVMSSRKYLARTKAMQIRMNISALEDWARSNNRTPDHYENGSTTSVAEDTIEAARRHLAPVIQLLQWLQCFSSLGDDFESLVGTLQQLPRLTPSQLLHSVRHYRAEVGEQGLTKGAMRYLVNQEKEALKKRQKDRLITPHNPNKDFKNVDLTADSPTGAAGGSVSPIPPSTPTKASYSNPMEVPSSPPDGDLSDDGSPDRGGLLIDPAAMLPFSLPTSTDMLVSYGAGFGGLNRERERKYIPTVPAEFLAKFDVGDGEAEDDQASRRPSHISRFVGI